MIPEKNWLAKEILGKASKNKFMVGKFFQGFFFFLMNGERLSIGTVHA